MKKQILIIVGLITLNLASYAQKEYKISKSSGTLSLNLTGAIIEGYEGKEVIISGKEQEKEKEDDRAKGLVAISGSGLVDNTGFGLSVNEKGDETIVSSVSKSWGKTEVVNIKVPKNVKIKLSNNSVNSDNIVLKNLNNEIEISTSYNNIKLENNTGPMNVKTIYGSIDVIFGDNIKGPVSIISVHNYVDVTLPTSVKANLEMSTGYGNLYASKDFKIVVEGNEPPAKKTSTTTSNSTSITTSGGKTTSINISTPDISFSTDKDSPSTFAFTNVFSYKNGDRIKGKINGGGVDLIFKSNYKNVYLRNK